MSKSHLNLQLECSCTFAGNTDLHATAAGRSSTVNRSPVDSEPGSIPDTSRSAFANPGAPTRIAIVTAARRADVRDEPATAAGSRAA